MAIRTSCRWASIPILSRESGARATYCNNGRSYSIVRGRTRYRFGCIFYEILLSVLPVTDCGTRSTTGTHCLGEGHIIALDCSATSSVCQKYTVPYKRSRTAARKHKIGNGQADSTTHTIPGSSTGNGIWYVCLLVVGDKIQLRYPGTSFEEFYQSTCKTTITTCR